MGPLTGLHRLVVDLHVHHGGGAVPQDPPVAPVRLVAGPHLVGALVRPPQGLAWGVTGQRSEVTTSVGLF